MNEHVALKVPDFGYDTDYHAWSLAQAAMLRSGRLRDIDIQNIAEEIESLGRSDRRSLESQMIRLVEHLLKLQFATDGDPKPGWRKTVRDARRQIAVILDDSPSLRRQRQFFYLSGWPHAVTDAAEALAAYGDAAGSARLDALSVGDAPFSLDQALDSGWYPANA